MNELVRKQGGKGVNWGGRELADWAFNFLFSGLLYCLMPLLFITLTACGATVTPPSPVFLTVAGSTSMVPLMETLAAAYTTRQPHVTFDIQSGGSQLGQRLVEGNQVDIGLVSWPPQDLAADVRLVPVARDAVAVILHADNRHPGLSLAELQQIFSGQLLDWRAVDGPALPIQVVSREEGSGTRAAFESLVMENRPVTPTAVLLPNSRAVVDFVAEHPNAVGYVSFQVVNSMVYAVPVEGISPTLDNLMSEQYPLRRELSLLVAEEAKPAVAHFVEFSLSPTGQALIGEKWSRIK